MLEDTKLVSELCQEVYCEVDMTLKSVLKSFTNKRRRTRIGVMVSGGIDSMVLLDVLSRLSKIYLFDLRVIHIHFKDFPTHDRAKDLVQRVCEQNNLEVVFKEISSARVKKAQAREYMRDVAKKSRNDFIFTGHHSDDQIETILYRLLRGTGVEGLTAMSKVSVDRTGFREVTFVKPFINLSKKYIFRYAMGAEINYDTDTTNTMEIADRNFIRNSVIPMLNTRFDVNNILTTANNIREHLENLDKDNYSLIDVYSGSYPIVEFIKLSVGNRVSVIKEYFRLIHGYTINGVGIRELKTKLEGDITTLSVMLSGGYKVMFKTNAIVCLKI